MKSRLQGNVGGRERKPKSSQGLQIQRLVVPPKPRERGSFLKWCVHWEVVNTLHRAFCCPFSARGPELKPQKDLGAHGEWAGGGVEAISPHISALSLKAVCFFHVCIWIGRVPDTEKGGGGETEQIRRENGVGASGGGAGRTGNKIKQKRIQVSLKNIQQLPQAPRR